MSDAAVSIVSSAARYLSRLAIDEAKYLHGVKYKVVELRDELRWMQVFVEHADTKLQNQDKLVDLWISQINDFSYEAEDIVDKYLYGVLLKRKDGILNTVKWFCFTCCNIKDAKTLHQVGSEIDALTQKICKLTSRLQTYKIKTSEESSSSLLTIKSTADPSPRFQEPFVGEGKDIKEWVNKLAYGGRTILSGPTGTGKTSLALAAYFDKDVATYYTRRAWVVVSRQFDRNKFLYDVFFALRPECKDLMVSSGLPSYDTVRSLLADIFKYDRCFVVLDDVTTAEDWSLLEGCFPTDPAGHRYNSHLLVTTQDRRIADLAGNKLPELGPLSYDDGRYLFCEKACLGKQSATDMDQKMRLMEEMLLKSCCWPSLIVQLGGILSTLEDVKDWHTVNEGISTAELGKSIKEMTYRFLPNRLKPFFLYLGMFPAKFKLLAKELYSWWAVEGMITARDGRSADSIAESYMYELVNRGMVQVVRVNVETRRIEMVMLHHSMREVCLEEARKNKFLKIVSSYDTKANSHDDSIGGRDYAPSWSYSTTIRRLAVHMDEELQDYYVKHADIMFYKAPYLRSFLLFSTYSGEFLNVKRWIQLMSNNYPSLRVLSLDGAVGNITLPKEIGNFIHLRVLSLKGCVFAYKYQLPPTIGNLRSLQTLELRASCELMIIPNFFPLLKQLIHLCFPMKHMAPTFHKFQLDGLIHLETLKNLDLRQCRAQVFLKLKKLRRISIIPFSLSTKELPKLKSLLAIQTIQAGGLNKPLDLHITNDVFSRGADILSGCKSLDGLFIQGMTLSAKVQSLESLVYLSSLRLIDTELYEDPMPVLGTLPKLKVLALSKAYSGQDMACSSTNDFPQLTDLSIILLKNLKRWLVKEGALRNLGLLWIDDCDKLTTIRGSFLNLTRLILEALPRLEEGTVVESMPEHTQVSRNECPVELRQRDSRTVKFLPSSPCEDDEDDESCAGGNHEERETSTD